MPRGTARETREGHACARRTVCGAVAPLGARDGFFSSAATGSVANGAMQAPFRSQRPQLPAAFDPRVHVGCLRQAPRIPARRVIEVDREIDRGPDSLRHGGKCRAGLALDGPRVARQGHSDPCRPGSLDRDEAPTGTAFMQLQDHRGTFPVSLVGDKARLFLPLESMLDRFREGLLGLGPKGRVLSPRRESSCPSRKGPFRVSRFRPDLLRATFPASDPAGERRVVVRGSMASGDRRHLQIRFHLAPVTASAEQSAQGSD